MRSACRWSRAGQLLPYDWQDVHEAVAVAPGRVRALLQKLEANVEAVAHRHVETAAESAPLRGARSCSAKAAVAAERSAPTSKLQELPVQA